MKILYEPTGEIFENYYRKPRVRNSEVVAFLYIGIKEDGTEIALEEDSVTFIDCMGSEVFKEIPFTIEIDWNGGTVWLNNHVSKEKIVIKEKDSKSISDAFKLLEAKKRD